APPPASLSEEDLATIRAAGDAFEAAGASNDWTAVAALYTEDAVLMPPNAPSVTGRAAIQEVFEQFPTITSMDLTIEDIQGSGDLATVRGSYSLAMDIEGDTVEDTGKYLEVRRKQADGSWPMIIDTWNSDIPVPVPGEAEEM
ncbi:MAG: SgcJ/EcaC family oxidoreductase, partial [Rhodothermia bacterium]|nr:SgcJ/EcaC family oxidoreductase [Rhodothermia bacterium]